MPVMPVMRIFGLDVGTGADDAATGTRVEAQHLQRILQHGKRLRYCFCFSRRPRGIFKANDIGAWRFQFHVYAIIFEGDIDVALAVDVRSFIGANSRRMGEGNCQAQVKQGSNVQARKRVSVHKIFRFLQNC